MAKPHYLALDGFRGIAALCVVFYHLHHTMQGPQLLPHAWLAVDFFFMLSGFVLMHAYKDRLANGMTFGSFILARVKRLWPLILLGSAIAPLPFLMFRPEIADPVRLSIVTAFSALLVPILKPTAFADTTFPLNVPLWSLSFEMLASVAFGVWALKPARWVPPTVAALSLAALIVFTVLGGNLERAGPTADLTLLMGIPRIGLPFALGMLLYRAQTPTVHIPGAFTILSLLLATAFAVPQVRGFDAASELAAIAVGFPLLLLAAARLTVSGWEQKLCRLLADLSYPIYVLHWPLLLVAGGTAIARSAGFYVATVLAICAVAFWTLKLFDEPIRKLLSSRRPARSPAATAFFSRFLGSADR